MKKIKFIPLVLMAFALMVTSCTINDDYPTEASNKPVVKVHFESSDVVEVIADAELFSLPVLLTQAIEGNTLIEYTVDDEFFSTVISSGSTSFTIPIDRSSVGNHIVKLNNLIGTSNAQTKSIDTDLDTVTINVLPATVVFVTSVGDVDIVLDWATGEDLDLYLRDEPGFAGGNPNIDYSWWDQPEMMTMTSGLADGTYYIGTDNFSDAPPTVDCTLTLTFPDSTTYEVFNQLTTVDYFWTQIDKSTNGSEVTYTIYI